MRIWIESLRFDPAGPTIAVAIVVIIIGTMLAQAGTFGPLLQWLLRPDGIQ